MAGVGLKVGTRAGTSSIVTALPAPGAEPTQHGPGTGTEPGVCTAQDWGYTPQKAFLSQK